MEFPAYPPRASPRFMSDPQAPARLPQYQFGMHPPYGTRYHQDGVNNRAYQQQSTGCYQDAGRPGKRRRVEEPGDILARCEYAEQDAIGSVSSECCSSCPDGVPCAEPNCDMQKEILIECTRNSCASSVCPDGECPITGANEYIVQSSDRTNHWISTPWNHQTIKDPLQNQLPSYGTASIDPGVERVLESLAASSVSGSRRSSCLSPPNTANNFDPLSYPQVGEPHQNLYDINDTNALSGANTLFNLNYGPTQSFDPNFGSINCNWDDCAQLFSNQEEFTSHLHRNHLDPQMIFECPVPLAACPQNANHNPLSHMESVHGFIPNDDNTYQCPAEDCPPQVFCNPADLHRHFDIAHATPATGSLHCAWNSCGTVFTDQGQLLDHLPNHFDVMESKGEFHNNQHLKAPDFLPENAATLPEVFPAGKHVCKWDAGAGICGQHMSSEGALQDHIREKHLGELSSKTGFLCKWENCDRNRQAAAKGKLEAASFTQRQKLERHVATHTLYKNSECPICHKTFSAKQALTQHMHTHTGEKPWKCTHPGCEKAFAQQSALTMHERTHTGDKPLKCEICGKGFSESSNLTKHRKIHGIHGAHPCEVVGCGRSFYRADQLKKHMLMHKKDPLVAYESSGEASSVHSTPAPNSLVEYW